MKFMKRLLIALLILAVLIGTAYLLRGSILRGIGNYLVKVDTEVKVDAAFILSGNAYERSRKGIELIKEGYTPLLIATGEGVNDNLKAVGMDIPDAKLGQEALLRLGADSSAVRMLRAGTSTFEESEAILGYAQELGFKRVIIVSSKFHTRRIRKVFRKKFKQAGIDVFIVGAEPLEYKIDEWWNSEMGMIFVNNEYMKLLYYAWKYPV